MSSLVERLQAIRLHFGSPSARKLSSDLGIALNSWGVWEAGTNLPSATALIALAKRGIDVHWVLTGEGEMLRSPDQSDVDRGLTALSQLFHAPRSSYWKQRMGIMDLLAKEFPRTLSIKEIMSQEGLTQEQVSVCLLMLVGIGKAVVSQLNGELVYSATSSQPGVVEQSANDKAEMVVDVLRFVGTEVVPASDQRPSRGLLFDGRIAVENGAEFIDGVLSAIKSEADQRHSSSGASVRLVLAATIE